MIDLPKRHLSWKLPTTTFFLVICQLVFAFSLLASEILSAKFWMSCGFFILFSVALIERKKMLQSFPDYAHEQFEHLCIGALSITGLVCLAIALWLW